MDPITALGTFVVVGLVFILMVVAVRLAATDEKQKLFLDTYVPLCFIVVFFGGLIGFAIYAANTSPTSSLPSSSTSRPDESVEDMARRVINNQATESNARIQKEHGATPKQADSIRRYNEKYGTGK